MELRRRFWLGEGVIIRFKVVQPSAFRDLIERFGLPHYIKLIGFYKIDLDKLRLEIITGI